MKVEDEAASAAHKKAATKIMGFAHCVAAGDEEGTVAAEEEAGAAPGVALLEEYPEHFEPLLTADGAAEGAASAAELAAMVADGGCAFDEALRSAEEV
eukprot:gene11945-8528_t